MTGIEKDIKKNTLKYYISTYGCQMNEHDSEYIAGYLTSKGFSLAEDICAADFVLINSCTIRWKAEEKAFSEAGRLKRMKEINPNLRVGFCGCVAQREGARIFERSPHVDLVFGTLNIKNLPLLLKRLFNGEKNICEILNEPAQDIYPCHPLRASRIKAWVTIMEGCNNYCTYCVVPYVRGRERSKKPEDIMKEASFLASLGYKEITLLGQNVNSYGKDLKPPVSFAKLLYHLENIKGIERIRFITSHPKDLSMELIRAIKECKKVCEHIHLPLQAGADTVLKKMGRGYTLAEYMDKVMALRESIPGISITGDVICGFPGETETDFEQTLNAIKRVKFDGLFVFKYSPRPQTAASLMTSQIPEQIRLKRLQKLQYLQNQICSEMNSRMLDTLIPVLIEGPSKKDPNKLTGRTRTNKIVNMPGSPDLIGQIITAKITRAKRFDLEGEIT